MDTTELLNRMWKVIEAVALGDPYRFVRGLSGEAHEECVHCLNRRGVPHAARCLFIEAQVLLEEQG